MASRNRQRDAYVGVVQMYCSYAEESLPPEVLVVFELGTEIFRVYSLEFSIHPDLLVKRLWTQANSTDEAAKLAAFMSTCEFVIRDRLPSRGLPGRRCSLVDAMSLRDREVDGKIFWLNYIPQ